jgi:hypothetical protein
MPPPLIRPGVYRHFKGNLYEVVGVAQLVDSPDWFVVYRPLYGDRELVVRPYAEFTGTVNREGRERPRFEFIQDAPSGPAEPTAGVREVSSCR